MNGSHLSFYYSRMKVGYRSSVIPLLNSPADLLREVTNVLAEHFHNVISSYNYKTEFKQCKARAECPRIIMSHGYSARYNKPFTIYELQ